MKNGHIELILGPMFSGKSSELIRRIRRHQIGGKRCLLIKYAKDTRYADNECATHSGQTLAAVKAHKLMHMVEHLDQFDVIGIDEGQFFLDVVEFADKVANNGAIVLVAGLDGTFERKKFNRILELVPLAETVNKLKAVCMTCGDDAAFTKRLSNDDKRIEVIGGTDKYMACCRICYKTDRSKQIERHPLNENFVNIQIQKDTYQ